MDYSTIDKLTVTSYAFKNNGTIPIQYKGRGKDISPDFKLSTISENGKSIAIIMDNLDVPAIGILNRWVIWNIPIQEIIPENIPHGAVVESLGNAVQGKILQEAIKKELMVEVQAFQERIDSCSRGKNKSR